MGEKISKKQLDFYRQNKQRLIIAYIKDFPFHIDPDAVRDCFMEVGYNRTNVRQFQAVSKLLTRDIYFEILKRNKGSHRKIIFACGLPATGKTSHLKQMNQSDIVYDGTINNEEKFLLFIESALQLGYPVEIFIYSADAMRAFRSNLLRGDQTGRYVPISHYEKVANSINKRPSLISKKFKNKVKIRNFSYTNFEGLLTDFIPIKVNRNELERIARRHQFPNSKTLQEVIG